MTFLQHTGGFQICNRNLRQLLSGYDHDVNDVLYYQINGHPFGLKASVVNFNRVPHALSQCSISNWLFATATTHFVDDYITIDITCPRSASEPNAQLEMPRYPSHADWPTPRAKQATRSQLD